MAIPGVSPNAGTVFAIASVALAAYIVGSIVYNLFFHPLRSFPGPLLWRATRVPWALRQLSGRLPFDVLDMHRRYGAVVRMAPDELVFADARAWRDIMGHRAAGEPEFEKSEKAYRTIKNQPLTLINAGREEHGRVRRQLAHGFSERSVRGQQPIIMGYIDLLIKRLYENCAGGAAKLDMVKWYNYTTFDIIGDLAFGESFGCLDQSEYHPWVAMIFQSVKLGTWLQVMKCFPWAKPLLLLVVPRDLIAKRKEHLALTREKLLKRMDLDVERPDFLEGLLHKKEDLGLDFEKLRMTASLLIIAGSETTATLLSGVTYLLTKHPETLARLVREVRTSFKGEEDINFVSVSQLQYMMACLDEALRMYPPAPLGLPRDVPKGGANIAGHWVPEKTMVSMYHYALYHNEKFFKKPEEFHPERWLGDPEFATDDRDIFQPFHIGPRNCIGRNLAYIEMRLILARVLWNFDMTLADDSKEWIEKQDIFLLWEKAPLNVHLTPRLKN